MLPSLIGDFPLLNRRLDGKRISYLDSAATALKPRAVLEAEAAYSTQFTANIHRGKHALSEEASAAYEASRARVARLLNADPHEVVFVRNTTEALNLVSRGLKLSPDDVVLVPTCEHHSNIVPWMRAARVEWLEASPLEPLNPEAVARAIEQHRPKVLAFAHASNLTGLVQPAAALCRLARERGVLSVVDGAQSVPHLLVDVEAIGCDFLAFSGHKMLGPTGVGVLFGRGAALERLDPLMVGGGVVNRVTRTGFTLKDVPYRFEAGTPAVSGALGLRAAIDYLTTLGKEEVLAHDRALADVLSEVLEGMPGVRTLLARPGEGLAIATLIPSSARITADHLALVLSDSHQMMVRSGFHCAHPCFDELGVTQGSLRVSAYVYTTEEELRQFGDVLRSLLTRLA